MQKNKRTVKFQVIKYSNDFCIYFVYYSYSKIFIVFRILIDFANNFKQNDEAVLKITKALYQTQ